MQIFNNNQNDICYHYLLQHSWNICFFSFVGMFGCIWTATNYETLSRINGMFCRIRMNIKYNTITVYFISISELMFQVLWTVIWQIVTSNYLYATSIECMENIENASLLTYFQFRSFMMVIAIIPFKKRKKKEIHFHFK